MPTTFTITNPIMTPNPFVEKATEVLRHHFLNPYPDVVYEYDGNEVQIDGEYYTLEPDVQAYLEDIDCQIDQLPIREVTVRTETLEIVDAKDRAENEGLSPSDEGYHHNGLIRFVKHN